jgi:DNA repair exonuclease SbcCD nuclease subunit
MSAFRFVHTADVHLDSPLRSLALRNPDLRELVSNATRRAFEATIDLCLDEQVHALLIAGDLYDNDQTSMKTARFLSQQLKRLHETGIRTYVIRGNHDAVSRISKELAFEDSVRIFGARAEAVAFQRGDGGVPVHIHGLSFAQPHAPDSLLLKYGPKVDGGINIGLLHTSLGGAAGHDVYSPCQASELQATNFDYWGLGHIHKRIVHEGRTRIVMPGMPQGRDIGEAGAKSVALVTIAGDGLTTVEERVTSVAQFEQVKVDLTGLTEWRELAVHIGRALERARAAARSEHLIARLILTGETPLAWQLRRDGDLARAEAEQRAENIGRCWIDKLEIACEMPRVGAGAELDKLSELRQLIDEEVIGSASFEAELERLLDEFEGQLPADMRDSVLPRGTDGHRIGVDALIQEGAQDVLARLSTRGQDAKPQDERAPEQAA